MLQNPYTEPCLRVVVDLTNRPPVDLADLVARWFTACVVPERPPEEQDLLDVRAYLVRWAEVVDAASEQQRIDLLNGLLADYTAHPRLSIHEGSTGWHLHYRADGLGLGRVISAAISVMTADHLSEKGMHRLGRCALPDCGNAYIDFTRGGRQRYCSQPCANRDAVRRHRAGKPKIPS